MREPERLSLARIPTPLEHLKRSSEEFGVNLWVKRDDLTGAAESGNKIRKLEYFAADALKKGADTLITCGGEQSNHCRTVAVVARKLGMDVHLVLRRTGEGPSGNWLLDLILGATFRWVTPEEYENHDAVMEKEAEKLRRQGKNPYIIPEGGSNALGVWGYFAAAGELAEQFRENNLNPDYVIVASGSGATYAGLWAGFHHHGVNAHLIGITAGPDPERQRQHIIKILQEFSEEYEIPLPLENPEIDLRDNFWRGGYGIIDEYLAKLISHFARTEGLILDPAYTGKAFYGMTELIKGGDIPKNSVVVFVHTGGIFGLFTKGQFFRELYFSGARVK